ncbi:MAG: hypothetical protein ACOCXH_10735 [Cyclobacteriaceae bacterium]
MQYELQFFQQIIHQNFQVKDMDECLEYLKSKYEQPLLLGLAKIKIDQDGHSLSTLDNYYFLEAEELKRTVDAYFTENQDQDLHDWLHRCT